MCMPKDHPWPRFILLLVAFGLMMSFVLLSKYEDRSAMRGLDFGVTVKVQERIDRSSHLRATAIVGNLMEGATFFASPEFTVIATLLITSFAIYDWKKKKWRLNAFLIPVLLVVIVILEIYGKSIVHHPSPPFSMIKHPTTVFPANYVNEQFSYPSGHAARAIFLSLTFYSAFVMHDSILKRKTWKFLIASGLIGYVVLVSVSRIYLGHHWFSDVIGGLSLGGGIATLGSAWFYVPQKKRHESI